MIKKAGTLFFGVLVGVCGVGEMVFAEVIHVNPVSGSDRNDGSPNSPYRSLTHALKNRRSGTIQLARGEYTSDTGEIFPIVIPAQVVVKGETATKGEGITVKGGGNFRSLWLGQQNVVVVLQDRAELQGVTIRNLNGRGTGLWVERGNPTIVHNRIQGNSQDGITVVGRSAPLIQENIIDQNTANGITIDHSASPLLRQNLISNNGFGISIRQNSVPQLQGNKISQNQDGVIIQAQARPLLRGNEISQNQRTGVVVLARAIPDLGTTSHLGNNTLANNGDKDLQSTSLFVVAAHGNQLDPQNIKGNIDLNAQKLAIAPQPTDGNLPTTPITRPVTPPVRFTPANPTTNSANSVVVSLRGTNPALNGAISSTLPPIALRPPEGSAVNRPIVISPPRIVTANSAPARFRLVVPILSADTLDRVRTLFPDAFASNRGGRGVVQVGAYSDRNVAIDRLRQLNSMGLTAVLETISN